MDSECASLKDPSEKKVRIFKHNNCITLLKALFWHFQTIGSLNINEYATKKTIAQGLINMALFSANASQLNFILKVGPMHRFYWFLLMSIGASIFLQVSSFRGIFFWRKLRISGAVYHSRYNLWNKLI